MGVRAWINGLSVWNGKKIFAQDYTYSEDSTPIDASDTFGGSPQLTLIVNAVPGDKEFKNKDVEVTDGSLGRIRAIGRTPSGNEKTTSIQADGRTALLNVQKQTQPFTGTLSAALLSYFALCGLTSQITIDSIIGAKAVVLPGWNALVADMVRMLLVINGLEMTEIGNEIVIRPIRQRVAERLRDTDNASWSIDSSSLAKQVEGFYYNNTQRSNTLIYPFGGWNDQVQVYQVDAGSTLTFDLPVNASLTGVQQPVAVDSVTREYVNSSVYSVTGSNGLPVPAAQWLAGGGRLEVKILDDLSTLRVTVTGMNGGQFPPYRLANPAGPSNVYSSLRIVATGVFWEEKSELIYTGANETLTSQDVGASVKIPFINTRAEMYDAMIWAVARWCGPIQKLTISTAGIQRKGERNAFRYPTIREFNAANIGKLISDFNVEWAGKTIAQFNAYWDATVVDEFENQAFGNMGGARLLDDGQWYRVRTSQRGKIFQLSLEKDTTVRDFNTRYTDMTIAQFNAFWKGKTLSDFNSRPLREGL